MGSNKHTGQLIGPFTKNQELIDLIKADTDTDFPYIEHLGIQYLNYTPPIASDDTLVYINNKPYEIGKTGIYEIGNTEIRSIYFSKDVDDIVVIDYVIFFEDY